MGASASSPGQVIAHPTGGGALRGIGESFSADLHTGSGNLAVPITLPQGRGGFQPELVLTYGSGDGNGHWGLGWSVRVPHVARKTSKGVPRFTPGDIFLLAGSDDLVAVEETGGVVRYRPRTEGLFARIERYRDMPGDRWEVCTKDGRMSRFGSTPEAVVRDGDRLGRVQRWLLTDTRDPFGNLIEYHYASDRPRSEEVRAADAANGHVWNGRVLERVSYVDYDDGGTRRSLASVTFTYADRPDPFSAYTPGFEVRTALRCTRILVETHADPAQPQAVRAYELLYADELPDAAAETARNGASLLAEVRVVGYEDNAPGIPGAARSELPPLSFSYTRFEPARRRFTRVGGPEPPPSALDTPGWDLADVTGNGLPDILELDLAARYWPNVGGRFDRPRNLASVPAARLSDAGVRLLDADGDGRADVLTTELGGYFPLRPDGGFDPDAFQRYRLLPSVELDDPEVRLTDIDGDGITDILRSGTSFECYFNAAVADEAWQRSRSVTRRPPPVFPDVSFADPRVKLADLTGDGLQDIALINSGNVAYWPNLGHGDWAPRVQMRNSPRLPNGYDPRFVLLGDVDGDGLADLLFVEDQRLTLWLNRSGNAWSEPIVIGGTPPLVSSDAVRLVDLLGTGTRGVLWSSGPGAPTGAAMFFLDLTGGVKPYLLAEVDNHVGAVTRITYRSSTVDALDDNRRATTRWRTALPFPVQVVARVEVEDLVTGTHRVTTHRYHHGYWDGREREFRGFGRVDTFDAEPQPGAAAPLETRTWFHQGAVELDARARPAPGLSPEHWGGDPSLLEDPSIPDALTPQQRRDALRTLRGSILRTEVYARDGTPAADRPITVTESGYGVSVAGAQVFFPHLRASRTTAWERGEDPLTSFEFRERYDDFGRPADAIAIAMPRRSARRRAVTGAVVGDVPVDPAEILTTLRRTLYAEPDATAFPSLYLHNRVDQLISFELRAPPQLIETDPGDLRAVLRDQAASARELRDDLEQALADWRVGLPVPALLRVIGHARHHYDGAAFEGRSDGRVGPAGALSRSTALAFGEEELLAGLGDRRPDYLEGPLQTPPGFGTALGYRRTPAVEGASFDGWYVDTVRQRVDASGAITATKDALGHQTDIQRDRFDLLPVRVTDACGLVTSADYNYRVLEPARVVDTNGHATCYAYSSLGLLQRRWLEGRDGQGGTEAKPETRLDYDFLAFEATRASALPQPISVHTTRRVQHARGLGAGDETVEQREYSDGFGRLIQRRTQAAELACTDLGLDPDWSAPRVARGERIADRTLVTGWQVYDAKGRVVEKFEPFFAAGWSFEPDAAAPRGRRVSITYDPQGRIVETINPDGARQRVVHGVPTALDDPGAFEPSPWESCTYDANDLEPGAGHTPAPTREVAPVAHRFTPTSRVSDGLGRIVAETRRNGSDPRRDWFVTRSRFDVRGNLVRLTDALGRPAFTFAYDLLNRPMQVAGIDTGVRTSVLDAFDRLVEQRDSRGTVALREYDPLNRPRHVWACDEPGRTLTLRERIEYGDGGDPGQPAAERAANRAANRLGRIARHWDEAGLVTYEAYDFKGNPVEKVRRVVRNEVVDANWVPDWDAPDAAADLDDSAFEVSMRFDALDRATTVVAPRETRSRDPGAAGGPPRAVISRRYDRGGGLAAVDVDGHPLVTAILYNARRQRVLVAYGNGLMTRTAYDPDIFRPGRVRTERLAPGPSAVADSWVGSGAPLQDALYAYDPVGNLVTIDEQAPNAGIAGQPAGRDRLVRRMAYDSLYRLLSASGRACRPTPLGGTPCGAYVAPFMPSAPVPRQDNGPDLTEPYEELFTYDPVGNRLETRYVAPSGTWVQRHGHGDLPPDQWRDAPDNRLTSVIVGANEQQFAFDANGNLRQRNTERHFGADHADRLTRYRVQPPGAAASSIDARYLYGADGTRVKKVVRRNGAASAQSTVFVDGIFERHDWTEDGQPRAGEHLHIFADETRVAVLRRGDVPRDDAGPPVQYHLAEPAGAVGLVVGADGAWVNREEHRPYGETSFGGFVRKRYRWGGKLRDEESGLAYHGARYYEAGIGRWISADPAGPVDGPNVYAAFGCSPLTFRDPTGLQSQRAAGGSPDRVTGVCLDYTQISPDDPRLLAAGAPRIDTRDFLRIRLGPRNVPRNQGPTLSADTLTPAEHLAAVQEFRRYDAFLKQFPGTPYDVYRLYISAQAHAANDPVRWTAQFGTAKNMPGYRAPSTTSTYVRGAPTYVPLSRTSATAEPPPTEIRNFQHPVEIGSKLEYLYGRATGREHNLQRTNQMLELMNRIGIPDTPLNRQGMAEHFRAAFNAGGTFQDSGSLAQQMRTVHQSILIGPNGTALIESVWEQSRLITFTLHEVTLPHPPPSQEHLHRFKP
jgi:RHS repeat-associated protein